MALFLELEHVITAIDSLHLLVLVDDEEHRGVGVHESHLSELNLEFPELDQVLRSRELEEEQTVLLGIKTDISRAHLYKELVFDGGAGFNLGHRVELEAPFVLCVHSLETPHLN